MSATPENIASRPQRAVGVYDRPSRWRSPRVWMAIALGVTAAIAGIAFLAS